MNIPQKIYLRETDEFTWANRQRQSDTDIEYVLSQPVEEAHKQKVADRLFIAHLQKKLQSYESQPVQQEVFTASDYQEGLCTIEQLEQSDKRLDEMLPFWFNLKKDDTDIEAAQSTLVIGNIEKFAIETYGKNDLSPKELNVLDDFTRWQAAQKDTLI